MTNMQISPQETGQKQDQIFELLYLAIPSTWKVSIWNIINCLTDIRKHTHSLRMKAKAWNCIENRKELILWSTSVSELVGIVFWSSPFLLTIGHNTFLFSADVQLFQISLFWNSGKNRNLASKTLRQVSMSWNSWLFSFSFSLLNQQTIISSIFKEFLCNGRLQTFLWYLILVKANVLSAIYWFQ